MYIVTMYMTFWDITIYSDILHWTESLLNIDLDWVRSFPFSLVTEMDLITYFGLIIKFREVSLQHFATGEASKQRTLTPTDTWPCPISGLAFDQMLRLFSPVLFDFEYRTSIGGTWVGTLCSLRHIEHYHNHHKIIKRPSFGQSFFLIVLVQNLIRHKAASDMMNDAMMNLTRYVVSEKRYIEP